MGETLKAGSVLIKEGIPLPKGLHIGSDPYVPGWRLVRNFDGPALDSAVRQAGWTFFRLAGEIKAAVFGFDTEKTARRAVARILAKPRSKQFNSLAITEVISKRLLGIPYVRVVAQSRHIQESLFLFSPRRIKDAAAGAPPAATPAQAWGLARAKEVASEPASSHANVATTPNP